MGTTRVVHGMKKRGKAERLIVIGLIVWLAVLSQAGPATAAGELQYAEIGDVQMEGGQVIEDCRLGYRTFGRLNHDKSNAVLIPTWFAGISAELMANVGPGKLVDSTKYFVIVVDALGNGVSSSPSNSASQPGGEFPPFTIRDMVKTQRLLVTKTLKLSRLHAVAGISMGGAQALQWAVTHPDMVGKAVSIIGSPKMTVSDLLLWNAELRAIELGRAAGDGSRAMPLVGDIHGIALYTPGYRNKHTTMADFEKYVAEQEARVKQKFQADDWESQVRAIMGHDITKGFNGSLAQVATTIKPKVKVLLAVSEQDQMVNPSPSLEFATFLGTKPVILRGDCGHAAFLECGGTELLSAVGEFLDQ